MAERETLEIDALFVGAGPASLAGACHLARLLKQHNAAAARKVELSIAVLEKGAEVGALPRRAHEASVRGAGSPRSLPVNVRRKIAGQKKSPIPAVLR